MVSGPAITREVHAKLLRSLEQLPRLSPNVNRLLGALASVEVEFKEVGELVTRDVLLSAHILKLANSALHNRGRELVSVQQAITYLGLNILRRAALSFSLLRLVGRLKTPPVWSFTNFNQHAGATATLAEIIAHSLPSQHEDKAFVAGLLHDLGKVIIAVALPNLYEDVTALARVSERTIVECEREVIGIDHAELSALALVRWNFPEPICRAVQYHHTEQVIEGNELCLSTIVRIADEHVNHLGVSMSASTTVPPTESTQLNGFQVSLDPCFSQFRSEWAQLAPLFR